MQDYIDTARMPSKYQPAAKRLLATISCLCLLVLPVVTGCGPNQIKRDLSGVAMEYHQYTSEMNSPPDSDKSLAKFPNPYPDVPGNKASSNAMKRALASGDYVVYWNYDVRADLQRNASVILAYHKDTPTNGGLAAFADATVRYVTKEEFENAAKASDFTSE